MRFSVLSSGSCGNSYIFTDGKDSILVDAGLTFKRIRQRCEAAGTDFSTVQAVFVTHLHPDHCNAIGVIARQTGLPIHISKRSMELQGDTTYAKHNVPTLCTRTMEYGETVFSGPFAVTSFATSHDSGGSCGYAICANGKKAVIITDTGIWSQEMASHARDCDILFLEANYDDEMLSKGPYPYWLKKRISDNFGHLSNKQARQFLQHSGFGCEKPVYLVHLSENNNTPSLAAKAMEGFNAFVCPRGEQVTGEF